MLFYPLGPLPWSHSSRCVHGGRLQGLRCQRKLKRIHHPPFVHNLLCWNTSHRIAIMCVISLHALLLVFHYLSSEYTVQGGNAASSIYRIFR